jgi:hypothetical protein
MDIETYKTYRTQDLALECAVKLLSATPHLLKDVKNTKELYDKAIELEFMFMEHLKDE